MLSMIKINQEVVPEEQETALEEREIGLLREWLPKIGGEYRAYIKGAAKALLYAQERNQEIAVIQKGGILV